MCMYKPFRVSYDLSVHSTIATIEMYAYFHWVLTVVAAHVGCLVVSAASADLGDQEAEAEQQEEEEEALVHGGGGCSGGGGGGEVTVRLRVAQLCDAATNLELDWNMLSSTLTGACCLLSQCWLGWCFKNWFNHTWNCGL